MSIAKCPSVKDHTFSKKSKNLFAEIHKQWGLVGKDGLNNLNFEQSIQTQASNMSTLETIRKQAEIIATDVVLNLNAENQKKSPDRFCKAMRKTVKEVSDRHDISLKSMVKRLNLDNSNLFQTFVSVADKIFEDGQINWGRIIVVYAFAARVALLVNNNQNTREKVYSHPDGVQDDREKVALYVGRYVANKLGHWIAENGGWEAFADFFSNENQTEDKIWKGLLFTATLGGLGALAAVMGK